MYVYRDNRDYMAREIQFQNERVYDVLEDHIMLTSMAIVCQNISGMPHPAEVLEKVQHQDGCNLYSRFLNLQRLTIKFSITSADDRKLRYFIKPYVYLCRLRYRLYECYLFFLPFFSTFKRNTDTFCQILHIDF